MQFLEVLASMSGRKSHDFFDRNMLDMNDRARLCYLLVNRQSGTIHLGCATGLSSSWSSFSSCTTWGESGVSQCPESQGSLILIMMVSLHPASLPLRVSFVLFVNLLVFDLVAAMLRCALCGESLLFLVAAPPRYELRGERVRLSECGE